MRTQNVSEQNQKHFLCPQQTLPVQANGETFVSATMWPRLPGPLDSVFVISRIIEVSVRESELSEIRTLKMIRILIAWPQFRKTL